MLRLGESGQGNVPKHSDYLITASGCQLIPTNNLKHHTAMDDIYLLRLQDDGSPDVSSSGYIYLPAPTDPVYSLRIAIEGTSSICREGTLWINIPEPGKAFVRSVYRPYSWVVILEVRLC